MPSNRRGPGRSSPARSPRNFTDIAYTDAVKAAQHRLGARARNEELEKEPRRTAVTPELAAWLAERISFFFGTASADGRPYIQHRGGPAGFLVTVDERHLGWAEFSGNKQYITTGNLAENDRAIIFAVDYAARRRLKLWGRAAIVEDAEFVAGVTPPGFPQHPTRAVRFRVEAWDINCPSYIPQLFTLAELEAATRAMTARIEELEAEVEELRRASKGPG